MNAITIKAARAGLDWTQARLAAEAGIHPKSVAYCENKAGNLSERPNSAASKVKDALARHGVAIEGNVVRFHTVRHR